MKQNYIINPYTGKPNSNNSLEGFVSPHTTLKGGYNLGYSLLSSNVLSNSLRFEQPMKHHNYTHDIHWQNSQNFISLLGQKELEIKSYEEKYKTLREDQKNEFVNLIKQTTLDSLKTQLKNNYFELDMLTSFKASIERLESVIDSWTTGVIQQPKQPSPNYLKLDQYTITQPSAKEFVEKYNNSIDFIEKQRESFNQLPHNKKIELIDQIRPKIVCSLEQQLRTGMYSPNARDEYERAIKKLVSTINDLALLPVINELPNQPLVLLNNQEDEEEMNELKTQLELLKLQIANKDNALAGKDEVILQLQTENHDVKDKLITSEKNNAILQNENHGLTETNLNQQNQIQDLTGKLSVSKENNTILQDKLNISEAKVMPLQEKVVDLKHYNENLEKYNDDLKNDKIELRKDKEMLAEYNKNLQKEKELSLVDKKHLQDLNQEQAFKITELSQIHCNVPGHDVHNEWVLPNMPLTGQDSNILQNDSD